MTAQAQPKAPPSPLLRRHLNSSGDPLFGIRVALRCGTERLTERQRQRITAAIDADEAHVEVLVAWLATQELRSVFRHRDVTKGRWIAEHVLDSFPLCAIPEIARLGRTLKQWREPFLAYLTNGRANNGGTEAVIGLTELYRRVARGFRNLDNYRLRMPPHRRSLHRPPAHMTLPPQVPRAG